MSCASPGEPAACSVPQGGNVGGFRPGFDGREIGVHVREVGVAGEAIGVARHVLTRMSNLLHECRVREEIGHEARTAAALATLSCVAVAGVAHLLDEQRLAALR